MERKYEIKNQIEELLTELFEHENVAFAYLMSINTESEDPTDQVIINATPDMVMAYGVHLVKASFDSAMDNGIEFNEEEQEEVLLTMYRNASQN